MGFNERPLVRRCLRIRPATMASRNNKSTKKIPINLLLLLLCAAAVTIVPSASGFVSRYDLQQIAKTRSRCTGSGHSMSTQRRVSYLTNDLVMESSLQDGAAESSDDGDASADQPDNGTVAENAPTTTTDRSTDSSALARIAGAWWRTRHPLNVEDSNVLFYDVFLLINLTLSVSFWAVHRMSFGHIGTAFNEGSLLSILWIVSGLYNGAFLNSAVDGHYDKSDDRAGPNAAGLLGLMTFVGTANLRIGIALVMAVHGHRMVGVTDGEQLIPLELAFGLVLMSMWRALHSSYVPRV